MWRVVVHSGVADSMPGKHEDEVLMHHIRRSREEAVKVLKEGGDCVDAVAAAIKYMEDCAQFNAGKGSVLSDEGIVEMDAAIMRGSDKAWGAVGYIKDTESNPILMAKTIMEGPELFLVGKGAEQFIEKSDALWKRDVGNIRSNLGTVGCVVLDTRGNLCAGMSSGGRFQKPTGRIGSAAVIGAGLYADDQVAISSSGMGEEFIKHSIANTIHCLLKYGKRKTLVDAAEEALEMLPMEGGGIIGVDKKGNMIAVHNCVKFYITSATSDTLR